MENIQIEQEMSVLARLRAVIPKRQLRFSETLRVAELQANRLLELSGVTEYPVPSDVISGLPHLKVEYRALPSSGLGFWDGSNWVICLDKAEPATRQRFTLLHEYKHIIDHGYRNRLYAGNYRTSAEEQAEQVADYFAGCALMPKRLLKSAWGNGLQRPTLLAALFNVSGRAIEVRLAQLGLTEPRRRCLPIGTGQLQALTRRPAYRRQSSTPTHRSMTHPARGVAA